MEIKDIFAKLKEKGLTFGSIESMTGGLFAAEFTSVPGSSKVFKGAVITYANEITSVSQAHETSDYWIKNFLSFNSNLNRRKEKETRRIDYARYNNVQRNW